MIPPTESSRPADTTLNGVDMVISNRIIAINCVIIVVAWPSIVVINSEFSNVVTQFGGITSFVVAILTVHGCTKLIGSGSPRDIRHNFSKEFS